MKRSRFSPVLFALLFLFIAPARAEEFYCEIMTIEGTATLSNSAVSGKSLQEGDLLKVDDLVEVSSGSYVDLAYDRDWNNITRVEENSKVRLRSIYPTTLVLEGGGVFAKLKALPKGSAFDVETPTAIASVRGTEYRTTFLSGETEIYNVSDSNVYVYGLDESGEKQVEPVVLGRSQTTQVQKRGAPPVAPRQMQEREFQPVKRFQEGIDRKVQENISRGRVGKIQDIKTIERFHEEKSRMAREGAGEEMRDKPKTLTADEAHNAVHRMHDAESKSRGEDEMPRHGDEMPQDGRKSDQNNPNILRSDESGKRPAQTRGLAEPYFPGNEKRRGGGPEPVGFSKERWESGDESNDSNRNPGSSLDARRQNVQQGQSMGDRMSVQPKSQQGPQRQSNVKTQNRPSQSPQKRP
jgi:hypothetical protein